MASITTGYISRVQIDSNNVQNLGSTAYGECSTATATAAKVVDMTGFYLVKGATIHVKFANAKAATGTPTLNVNATGAKPLVGQWLAGDVCACTYDGTSWVINSATPIVITGGSQTSTSTESQGENVFTFTKSDGTTDTFTVRNGKDGENATTTSIFSTTENGLVPMASGTSATTKFLKGDGTWATPANTDTKVTQSNATDAKWHPLVFGVQSGTTTPGAITAQTSNVLVNTNISVQPSTATISATTFKGALNGNADTATKATQDGDGNVITTHYSVTGHTHTKSEITDFPTTLSSFTDDVVAGNYAPLNASKQIDAQYLPSYVDDVIEGTLSGNTFIVDGQAVTPEKGKIYVDTTTNLTYRYTGSQFTEISKSITVTQSENPGYIKVNGSDILVAGKFTSDAMGLVPSGGTNTLFLRGDGTWETPTNTDTKVQQTIKTDNVNRPLLMAYSNNTATASVTNVSYRNNSIYANALSGSVHAVSFHGNLVGNADTATKATQDGNGDNIASTYMRMDHYLEDSINTITGLGSLPTLGTAISADDITSWSEGAKTDATVQDGCLKITIGSNPTLSYTSRSIPNVTSVGTLPSSGSTSVIIRNPINAGNNGELIGTSNLKEILNTR